MTEIAFYSFLAFSLFRLVMRTLYPYANEDGTFGSTYESENEPLSISVAVVLGNVLGSMIQFAILLLLGNWLVNVLR